MRLGIFITGQLRESESSRSQVIQLLQDAFPDATFVYGTWKTEDCNWLKHLPNGENVRLFDEFDIDYSPYIDNPKVNMHWQYQKKLKKHNPRHLHQTKQILQHNWLMKEFGDQFDVIVRTRWDVIVSPFITFDNVVKECYNTPSTISCTVRGSFRRPFFHFYGRVDWKNSHVLYETEQGKKFTRDFSNYKMLLDAGIILHRSEDWSTDLIDKLHSEKKLLAAEFGWYQALVENTSHKQWIHNDGGCVLARTLTKNERETVNRFIK